MPEAKASLRFNRLVERYLHQIALWVLAFSRMSVLWNEIGMHVRRWVLNSAHEFWRTTNKKPRKDKGKCAVAIVNSVRRHWSAGFYIQNSSQNSSSTKKSSGQTSSRDCKTKSVRPRRCVELAKKIYKAQKGRQSYILFFFWGVDCAGRIHSNPRRKKVLWWIPEQACTTWSARKTWTKPTWRPWGYRKSDGGSDSQRRRCKQEKRQGWTSVRWMLLEESTQVVLALGKLCEEFCAVTIRRVDRNHISSREARKLIATHQIMYHSSYLVYPRFPPPHQFRLHLHRRKLWQTLEIPATRRKKWKGEPGLFSTRKLVVWIDRKRKSKQI